MPVETRVTAAAGITVHRCWGELRAQDILEAMEAFYRNPGLPDRVLWDFREVGKVLLSAADIADIATLPGRLQGGEGIRGGRRALLVATDEQFGLARMNEAWKGSDPKLSGFEIRTFRDLQEALTWLEG